MQRLRGARLPGALRWLPRSAARRAQGGITGGEEFSSDDPFVVVGSPFERNGDVGAVVTEPDPDVERTPHSAAFFDIDGSITRNGANVSVPSWNK